MKSILGVLAVAATLALGACGGGSDGSKELFSLWTRDGDKAVLDISGGKFSTPSYMYLYPAGGIKCICETNILGTQAQGSFAVTGCIASPYNATDDQQCKALNMTGTYANQSNVLTLSSSKGTFVYR